MTNVTDAVDAARSYVSQLFVTGDVRLEEVELTDDDKWWNITVSIPNPTPSISPLKDILGSSTNRIYKIVKIDATNNQVKSVKIRII